MTLKLTKTQVNVGGLQVEGMTDGEGNFYVGVAQVATQFGLFQTNASRDIKRLHGKDFGLIQGRDIEANTSVRVLTLVQYEQTVAKLDRAGNKEAQNFRDLLVGLSLHQLFCDAFGIKFETQDRQAWLNERIQHKANYHPLLTQWLQSDGCSNYGREVNIFKAFASLPQKSLNEYTREEMQKLNTAVIRYDILRAVGKTHKEALKNLR